MALTQIDFDQKEEDVINYVRDKYKLNKPKAIKQIVLEYEEKINGSP